MGSFMENGFREPIDMEDGLYITNAQLEFFMNRPNGAEKIDTEDPEFDDYYELCQLYNAVYDANDKDQNSGFVFWNHEKNRISIAFPVKGKLYKLFNDRGFDFTHCEVKDNRVIL